MGAYIYGIILVGVSCAVVELLSIGGESKMKGHLRLVAGLCILVACIQPIKEGAAYIMDIANGEMEIELPQGGTYEKEDYQAMFDGAIADMTGQEIEVWVQNTLRDVFGITEDQSAVEVVMTEEKSQDTGLTYPKDVYICLTGKAILKNPHQIEAYMAEKLFCACYVSVGSGA